MCLFLFLAKTSVSVMLLFDYELLQNICFHCLSTVAHIHVPCLFDGLVVPIRVLGVWPMLYSSCELFILYLDTSYMSHHSSFGCLFQRRKMLQILYITHASLLLL